MRDIKDKNIKWWVGIMSFFVLFIFVGFFSYMKMSFVLNGVLLVAEVERSDTSPLATIKGNAKNAVRITINGREIYIDKDGSFSEPMALIPGLSVITIDTQDKFGKTKEKKFQLVYKESEGAVAFNKIK